MNEFFDVIIIGGGVVGSAVASEVYPKSSTILNCSLK